ncbi:hypothetical protein [uncultured Bacteroides sp.]|uniref:hypothetical protein n=1 Tax=uncultured Bacteroides sp. TaxID=162156 RepID=UPI002AAA9F58|nr:hypothetical protein [uncultured Bacteroides sp.]
MRKTKKEDVKQLTKDFVGYGHYKLNVATEDGRVLSAVTGDTELISRLDSELGSEQEQARGEAIEFVLSENQ